MRHLAEGIALVLFLVTGAAALAGTALSAVELQADREARFEVGKQLAARHPELVAAWQEVADAADPVNAAQAEVDRCLAQEDSLAGPIQEALKNLDQLRKAGSESDGVSRMPPPVYYAYQQWARKLDDLNSQLQIVDDRLKAARQRLADAQTAYSQAVQDYAGQMRAYEQEYDRLYAGEYPRYLKALQDHAKEAQARLGRAFIVEDLLPGEYTWSESAKDLGKVTITADNKVTGVPPLGREGTWKVTAEGLVVTVSAETWLFKPGPMFVLIGSNKGAGASVAVRQAMLRPTVLPDQAAYSAALKKLKDAAKQAKGMQVAAAEAQRPAAAQPAQPAAAQPAQSAAAQPAQSAAAQPAAQPAPKPTAPAPADAANADLRKKLETPVTLRSPYPKSYDDAPTDKISVQFAILQIARQAGLGYDQDTSYKNTNPACRNWVYPDFQDVPLAQAMDSLLGPQGLTYSIKDGAVVLARRPDAAAK